MEAGGNHSGILSPRTAPLCRSLMLWRSPFMSVARKAPAHLRHKKIPLEVLLSYLTSRTPSRMRHLQGACRRSFKGGYKIANPFQRNGRVPSRNGSFRWNSSSR